MKTQYIEGNDFVDDVLPIAVYLSITSIFTNINISFFGGSLDVSVRLKVLFSTKDIYFIHIFYFIFNHELVRFNLMLKFEASLCIMKYIYDNGSMNSRSMYIRS